MIKFLHAADFHLDAAFSALSREQAVLRREEQRELFRTVAAKANELGCDLLLLSGDITDTPYPRQDTLDCLQEAFSSCRAEIFIAPGNHDACTASSLWETECWPDRVHIFRESKITRIDLPEKNLSLYGAAFTGMDCPSLLADFIPEEDALPCRILLMHGELREHSPYNPTTEQQLAASGMQYAALGHVHSVSGPRKAGSVTYAWPGTPAGHGFDECGQKGVYYGELDETGCRLNFLPLNGRRYECLTVRAGEDALQAIQAALPADTAGDIYRITLEGSSDALNLTALEQALRPRFYALELRDRTIPKRSLWEACGEDTLRGLFLRELKQAYDTAAADEERQELLLAAQYGIAAMEGRELL